MSSSTLQATSRSSWKRMPLEDVTLKITKGTTPTTVGGRFADEGITFIKVESISAGGMLDRAKVAYIDDQSDELLRRSRLEESDVLFSIAGAIGRTYFVRAEDLPANVNQALAIIRFDARTVCPRFGYYALRDSGFQGEALGRVVQCAQANVNLAQVSKSGINVPPLAEQSRIAGLLAAYDDLIENNRRRMALLEDAARQLFREWFVRLRFPGREHTRVTNGIPEGWGRAPVSTLTTFLNRGITPHYDDSADGRVLNQKCVRGGRLDTALARRQTREFKPDRQVLPGDVLVNSTGEGTLGRVAQVLSAIPNCTVDTHVTIVRPAPHVGVCYFGMALKAWEPRLSTMGRGATNQTELSRDQIGEIELLTPAGEVVRQFEDFVAPIFRQVDILMEQNQRLSAARDLLLPRLMSGEIAA